MRWGPSGAGLVALGVLAALPAGAAGQSGTPVLEASGEAGRARAEVPLPSGWKARTRPGRLDATAPGGRRGCRHRASFRLRVVSVAAQATAPAWVLARLQGQGEAVTGGGTEDAAFLTVAPKRAVTALGLSARRSAPAGDGRVMAEVVIRGSATRRCRKGEARKVVKRLGRLVASVRITDVDAVELRR